MKYTFKQFEEKGFPRGFEYTVKLNINRWAKVGEVVDGKVIMHNRCYCKGRTICGLYFDNEKEAFEMAETFRKSILKHLEGKKVECKNCGLSLETSFMKESLLKHNIGDIYDHYHDYRFYEVLPYCYGVSISYLPD